MNLKLTSLLLVLVIFSCKPATKLNNSISEKINVGVFNRNGDSPFCIIDAQQSLLIDSKIDVDIISAADIYSDRINKYDVIVFPGGSGRAETNSLGQLGVQRIKDFVIKEGKGVVGICAGAYILSNTPGYPNVGLSGFKAIDIEHDHRGNGIVKFSLTKEGKEIFPELSSREISYCNYYEGPVLVPFGEYLKSSSSLATMESDVHLIEGTPANMTNNKPFVINAEIGKGRTGAFVGHPESTPGMRWMLPRLVRWAAKKKLVAYSSNVMNPKALDREILFDKDLRKRQYELYDMLFGSEEEKLQAIKEIVEIKPWSAKKWFNGMMRDSSPKVRLEAAKALVYFERTEAIEDIESAINNESDADLKKQLQQQLNKLKALLGAK